jgi:hypothetical protein
MFYVVILVVILFLYSITAILRPQIIILGLESWTNYFVDRIPKLFGAKRQKVSNYGARKERMAVNTIRMGGFFSLFWIALLLVMFFLSER